MAEEVIGRADYVLGLDNAGVRKGVAESEQIIRTSGAKTEKEAESSAYRTGVAIGNGIKTGAKVAAAATSALFAFATKGILELTNVQAEYTAETGASADEAARAGKAINEMAGRNIQPIGEIGKALAKVHTDLGLTGDEAEATTQTFLRFARATKQEASASVLAFDDILDAWGLTAKDAQAIMDQLIVSHQRYGGSIEENQRALAQLAPALRGLNLSLDDGIGLLNLFAANGLDASAAQVALNTAISKLPSGESLQEFLVRLSHVVDDGARAQLAIEVFGQKAGPKLANAIRPGVESLDDFKVGADEAAGATEAAAKVLDDTFGAKAQLMLNNFASKLRSLGSDWGPLLTGGASALSLLTSIFGDDLIRRLGPGIVNSFKKLGAAGGGALMDGIESIWTGAGGTVVGNFIASRIETMVDSTKNSRIAAAIRVGAAKSGALWGLIFAGAQGVASSLYGALASAIAASPAAGPVRSALLAAAIQMGTLQGTAAAGAFSKAFTAAMALAPLVIPAVIVVEFLKNNPPPGLPDFGKTYGEHLQEKQAEVDASGSLFGQQAGEAIGYGILAGLDKKLADLAPTVNAGVTTAATDVSGAPLADKVIGSLIDGVKRSASTVAQFGRDLANAASQGIIDEVSTRRSEVDAAWEALLTGLDEETTIGREKGKLLGKLVSKELREGLESEDPALKARSDAMVNLVVTQLENLVPEGGKIGKDGMELLRQGMASKNKTIHDAAKTIYDRVTKPLNPLPAKGTEWGKGIGANLVAGMKAYYGALGQVAGTYASIIADYLATHSPSKRGPLSLDGGPEGMGRRIVDLVTKGAASRLPSLNDTLNRGLSLSGLDTPFLVQVASSAPTATVRLEHTITAEGARALKEAGFDDKRVAEILREGADASGLVGNLQSLQAMGSS